MTQLGVQFGQDCACGGRTSHPHNARTKKHEASKRHIRFIQSQTTTMTPKTDGTTSASSSPSTSSTGGRAC